MPKRPPLCPSCKDTDTNNFYVDDKGRRTNAYCKTCHKQRCNERYHSKEPIQRKAHRALSYGITPEEFLEMYNNQEGKCAICKEYPKTLRGLHVDHCHTTMKVRGLLCHGCNTGIGALRENLNVFRNAIAYLGG
jgi:hypothetical protein